MPNVGVFTWIDTSEKSLGAFKISWATWMTSEVINEVLKSEETFGTKELLM